MGPQDNDMPDFEPIPAGTPGGIAGGDMVRIDGLQSAAELNGVRPDQPAPRPERESPASPCLSPTRPLAH